MEHEITETLMGLKDGLLLESEMSGLGLIRADDDEVKDERFIVNGFGY